MTYVWDYREEHTIEDEDGEVNIPVKQGTKDAGFIAQELKEVQDKFGAKELKTYQHYEAEFDEDGKPLKGSLGIDILEADYGKLLPVMVKAIQDLSEELDSVKAELASMKKG